ncbi:MAG: M20/M25/M40 family metallo-hydrolase [Alphaproteobacteria bacterium]|nr:M20/M25/M40 family metallo-hydrolase [Alphaproteobacteria bacterium]
MLETVADRLLAAIAARRDDVAKRTSELVRIPSVNPPGEAYAECCEALALRLGNRRFRCDYLRAEGAPGYSDAHPRLNIVTRREGARHGPCVHFNSHIDVAAAGQGWTADPFGGEICDGMVWGRGTADMDGGLAAARLLGTLA